MKQRGEIVHRDGAKGATPAVGWVWEKKKGGGGNVGAEAGSQNCGGDGQGKQG